MKPLTINGTIIDPKRKKGISGLTVEAWDKDLIIDDFLGTAVTNREGKFALKVKKEYYQELFFDRKPDIYFKVYKDGRLIRSTEDNVVWDVNTGDVEMEIPIALPAPAAIRGIGEMAGLKGETLIGFAKTGTLNHVVLRRMEEKKFITGTQRKTLSKILNFYHLSGNNIALTREIAGRFNSEKDLVKMDVADWKLLLDKKGVSVPEGIGKEEYARQLTDGVARVFPSRFLMERVALRSKKDQAAHVNNIGPLLERNDAVFVDNKIADLKWTGITAPQKRKIKASLGVLQQLVNTYKYLGIEGIINDKKMAGDKKEEKILKKINNLKKFQAGNPDIDLSNIDFFGTNTEGPANADWSIIPRADRPGVRKQMMSYQRVLMLSTGIGHETAEILLAAGLESAFRIGNMSLKHIIRSTGLSERKADDLLKKSKDMLIRTNHFTRRIEEIVTNYQVATGVDNLDDSLINDLKDIDGYDDLFGLKSYCTCDHCQSIISPAAYFVDLMHFIEKHVDESDVPVDNAIHLKKRRADLWNIELNCDNTHTMIPYLEIVNEVLETYIENLNSGKNAYTLLKELKHSFSLPFHLPLTEIRTYLRHFDMSLGEVVGIVDPDTIHPEMMGLSQDEYQLITDPDGAAAQELFGLDGDASSMAVTDFLNITGLSRDELDELLNAEYVQHGGKAIVERVALPDDIQLYHEEINQLNPTNLDRIHRFIRLYKRLPWSIFELDQVLEKLSPEPVTGSEPPFEQLARLLRIQNRLSLSVDELLGLFSGLPTHILESRFNISSFSALDPEEKKEALISGLKIGAVELEFICAHLAITPEGAALEDVQQLYRYVKLAKRLDLSLEAFTKAVDLWEESIPKDGMEPASILSLIAFIDQLKGLPFSIQDLWKLLDENGTGFYLTEERLQTLQSMVTEVFNRQFSELDFSVKLEMDPATIKMIIQLLEENEFLVPGDQEDRYKVTKKYEFLGEEDRAQFFSDRLDDNSHGDKIHEYLKGYFIHTTVLPVIAEYLGKNLQVIAGMAYWIFGVETDPDGYADNPIIDISLFNEFIVHLERLLFLSEHFNPDHKFFSFTAREDVQEKIFFIPNDASGKITLRPKSIVMMNLYHRFHSMETEESDGSLQMLLLGYTNGEFNPGHFAELTGCDPLLAESVYSNNQQHLPLSALDALEKLTHLINICRIPGIDGEVLAQLYSTNDDDLLQASQSLPAAFRSKYEDDAVLQEKLGPYHDMLRVAKRDALAAYILSEKELGFRIPDDLYEYFLLDVEMDGCARTSRIKAGISSLQLYVHRCLMNLEQSESEPAIKAVIDGYGRAEWEWRKNYRVWEANRKVFLYPENYVQPDLRDNKSHLFIELQNELLQRDITKEAAGEAYKKYLTQFAELGKLIIAGSYYFTDDVKETYYFFGRTNTDPYQYYYRTYEPQTRLWSPWKKIEPAVSSPYISAVIFRDKLFIFWLEKVITDKNKIEGGTSIPDGYDISLTLSYSYLSENGTWKNAQKIPVGTYAVSSELQKDKHERAKSYLKTYPFVDKGIYLFLNIPNDLFDDAYIQVFHLDLFKNELIHATLNAPGKYDNEALKAWLKKGGKEEDFPGYFSNNSMPVDFPLKVVPSGEGSVLAELTNYTLNYGYSALNNEIKIDSAYTEGYEPWDKNLLTSEITPEIFDEEISVVHGNKGEALVTIQKNQFLLRDKQETLSFYNSLVGGFTEGRKREIIYLTTALVDTIASRLYQYGLDSFLSIDTQRFDDYDIHPLIDHQFIAAREHNHLSLPFNGPFGLYYRELYFHIPFLIANHLNAVGKYEEAKYWYEKIFNPTAPDDASVHPDRPADRNWQHILFRNQDIEKMKDILTDEAAIELYKRDPFNPHAVARLRMNAYQKAIVMKYIDNLLDWGDHLFAQDTYESINEATMLYVLAKDILGEKPAVTGYCEAKNDTLTYAQIAPFINDGSDFLIALENKTARITIERFKKNYNIESPESETELPSLLFTVEEENTDVPIEDKRSGLETSNMWAFCVPPNETLLGYWDRVEDRLYKIRHCMNIKGMKRELALFQPQIDPMMLVRAKAAGLPLSDVIASLNAVPPAYRFTYLIEKAKQFAGTVQGFGSALLSALEKKDVEELTLLRNTHEQNILTLTNAIKEEQIKESQMQVSIINEGKINVENRRKYYASLIKEGLTDSEVTQQVTKHISTTLRSIEGILHLHAAISYLFPQAGSPFAMTYGGKQLGSNFNAAGEWLRSMSSILDSVSSSAGLEASFERRKQEWKQQLKLATQELVQIEKQKEAAQIREEIAKKDIELHQQQTEQTKELYDFYKDKFTNTGLYEYLAATLSGLYRDAYNLAVNMAKKAEQAYYYERDVNDGTTYISGNHWQAAKAGLPAGEKLILQLQQLENAYMESNTREYEITQTFSLMQLDALALVNLKANGGCEFSLPEYAYDLVYPGQYKRRIKSVQLTIPCVTGPYTNVNVTLNLLSSEIRRSAGIEGSTDQVPKTVVRSIATSSANNDAGVFAFNFRDERYLPFEGAGAISTWKLELPGVYRTFDYNTISDVLIHVSYTSVNGGEAFRADVESNLSAELKLSEQQPGLARLFSLKHEFSKEWFESKKNGSGLSVLITKQMFPFVFQGMAIETLNNNTAKFVSAPPGPDLKPEDWIDIGVTAEGDSWRIDFGADQELGEDILLVFYYKVSFME